MLQPSVFEYIKIHPEILETEVWENLNNDKFKKSIFCSWKSMTFLMVYPIPHDITIILPFTPCFHTIVLLSAYFKRPFCTEHSTYFLKKEIS